MKMKQRKRRKALEDKKYIKSTASQVGIGSLENLSQKIEKPPATPQSRNKTPKQGLVEDIIGIKPMTSDQPIIQTLLGIPTTVPEGVVGQMHQKIGIQGNMSPYWKNL